MKTLAAARIPALSNEVAGLTGRPVPSQPAELLRYIAREIAIREQLSHTHTKEIYSLNRRNNSTSFINKLPDDTLVEIFSWLLERPDHSRTALTSAASVCVRWRTVALSAPKFWTTFPLSHPEYVAEFLRRSGALPLTLSLEWDYDEPMPVAQTAEVLAPHVHRIQSLFVYLMSIRNIRSFFKGLNAAAPLLDELHIEYDFGSFAPPRSVKLSQAFRGVLPALRSLTLHNVILPSIPFLDNLRALNIGGVVPSTAYILDYLERCPRLETLILTELEPVEKEKVLGSRVIVVLPFLSELRLQHLDPHQTRALLSRMSLPEAVAVHVRISVDGHDDIIPSDPVSLSRLKCLHGLHQLELRMPARSENFFTLRASRTPLPIDESGDDADTCLRIRTSNHIPTLTHWLPLLSPLKAFVIRSGYGDLALHHFDWATFLNDVPSLEVLRLFSPDLVTLEDALCALQTGYSSDGNKGKGGEEGGECPRRRVQLCPRLALLEFTDAVWTQLSMDLLWDVGRERSVLRGYGPCLLKVRLCNGVGWTEESGERFRDLVRVS